MNTLKKMRSILLHGESNFENCILSDLTNLHTVVMSSHLVKECKICGFNKEPNMYSLSLQGCSFHFVMFSLCCVDERESTNKGKMVKSTRRFFFFYEKLKRDVDSW